MTEIRLNEIGNEIIRQMESLLGPRKSAFRGFHFSDTTIPELNFDGSMYFIHLTNYAKEWETEAMFEIAHEVIHLLTPTTFDNVSVFEEGLATYFSFTYLRSIDQCEYAEQNLERAKINSPNYYEAYDGVSQVSNVFANVKLLREEYPNIKISDFGSEQFAKLTNDPNLINLFLQKFNCR